MNSLSIRFCDYAAGSGRLTDWMDNLAKIRSLARCCRDVSPRGGLGDLKPYQGRSKTDGDRLVVRCGKPTRLSPQVRKYGQTLWGYRVGPALRGVVLSSTSLPKAPALKQGAFGCKWDRRYAMFS